MSQRIHRVLPARSGLRAALGVAVCLTTSACGAFPFLQRGPSGESSSPGWEARFDATGVDEPAYEQLGPFVRHVEAHPNDRGLRRLRATTLQELALGIAWQRRIDPAAAVHNEAALVAAIGPLAPGLDAPEALARVVYNDLVAAGAAETEASGAASLASALFGGNLRSAVLASGDPALANYAPLVALLCADAHIAGVVDGSLGAESLEACGIRPREVLPGPTDVSGAGTSAGTDVAADAQPATASVDAPPRSGTELLYAQPSELVLGYLALVARVAEQPSANPPEPHVVPLVAEHLRTRLAVRVAGDLPPAFWSNDPRLDVPVARMPADGIDGLTARLAPHVLLVRSDGFSVLPAPAVMLRGTPEGGLVETVDIAAGWSPDATPQVRFDGAGALPQSALDGEGVPELQQLLGGLTTSSAGDAGADAAPSRAAPGTGELSVVADGGVYVSTLLPLLHTARASGYAAVFLHARSREGELRTFPLRIAEDVVAPAHLLVVRSDGYLVTPYDPTALATPTMFLRTSRSCLLDLARHLSEAVETGTMDAGLPLRIRVDDGSLDIGLLAHLLAAITWRRATDGVSSDRELAEAPAVVVSGMPVMLYPGGVELLP